MVYLDAKYLAIILFCRCNILWQRLPSSLHTLVYLCTELRNIEPKEAAVVWGSSQEHKSQNNWVLLSILSLISCGSLS